MPEEGKTWFTVLINDEKLSELCGGKYIPDSIETSSDSSEDIEQIENDAEMEEDAKIEEASHNDAEMEESSHNDAGLEEDTLSFPNNRCNGIVWLYNDILKYYVCVVIMQNMPLKFAGLHFSLFGYENPTDIWDGNNEMWKAKLFVKRDSNVKIVFCNIREGVKEMMHGVKVMARKKVIVQLLRKNPLAFKVSIK
uniref:Uncharacterized protein n=1 Tax=Chenopodium quinoa TaxID=63459 RepID=A0A803MS60_CHEQI